MQDWQLLELAGEIDDLLDKIFNVDSIASGFEGWADMDALRCEVAKARATIEEAITDGIKQAIEKERTEYAMQAPG